MRTKVRRTDTDSGDASGRRSDIGEGPCDGGARRGDTGTGYVIGCCGDTGTGDAIGRRGDMGVSDVL